MQEVDKTKEQLATEVAQLRRRIAELEKSEEILEKEAILNTLVEHVVHENRKMEILWANNAACDSAGISREELIGRHCYEIWAGRSDPCPDCPVVKAMETGQLQEVEKMTPDGRSWFIRGYPLRDEKDSIVGGIEFTLEITEPKQAEEALRRSKERFRKVVETMRVGLSAIDGNGLITYVNDQMCQMLGYSRDEIIGRPTVDFYDEESRKHQEEIFAKRRKGVVKNPTPYEITWVAKDGHKVNTILTPTPKYDADGHFVSSFAIVTDITERKRMEQELYESEEKFRSMFELLPYSTVLLDLEGSIQACNQQFVRFHATREGAEAQVGRNISDFFPPEEKSILDAAIAKTIKEKKTVIGPIEYTMLRENGSRFPADGFSIVMEDETGLPKAVLGLAYDITERKQAEEALRESEAKYRSLVESSEDSIYLVDNDCTYLFMNKKHLSRLGLKSSQVIGKTYELFHSPKETKNFTQKVKQVLKTGKSLSYEYRSARDNRYFIRTLSPVKSSEADNSSVLTVISKDVTEFKQTEEALREREAFNFALFHYNPIETVVVDLKGRVTGFNLAKEKSGDRLPHIGDFMYKDYAGKHEIDMRAELMVCINSGEVKAFPERRYGNRYLSITISPFLQGALIISEDITERKRADELLQKERDTFFAILQKAPYGIVFIDRNEKTLFVNTEFTHITGYVLEDVPTIIDWFQLVYPDKKYRDMAIADWKQYSARREADRIFSNTFKRAFFRTSRIVCKNKTAKEVEFRPTMLEDGETIVMLSDITERKRMYKLLEAATMEWRTTFDAIGDAVCLLDPQGKIKRCNNAMLRMLGRTFSEIAGRTCWEVLLGVSNPSGGYPFARMQKSHHRETEIFSKDNRWFEVSVDPLLDEGGNLMGGVHIMSESTDRMQAEEELQKSREELRSLTSYLESVRERERTNIAREIHDELAQALTALKMDLSWLDNRLAQAQKPLSDKTKSMHNLIDTTIKTVKRISAELRPGILDDLGLIAAIEWQADEFQNRTGIICHLTVDPWDITVDQERATVIFRIFQETLTNVVRHAQAKKVTVALKERAGKLTLSVRDNGKGITEEQISNAQSFGLIGMRERVHPWRGTVKIRGTPGKGTAVLVNLPAVKV
jgi:PAS domain S-box-containing protein